MHEPLTLYKLIVLYMLNRADFILTRTQINDFLLNREYTANFLNLQQAIGELIDDGFISSESKRNRSFLKITEEGAETLQFFQNQMDPGIRSDIDAYLKESGFELRNENSVVADYRKTAFGEYEAHLVAMEGDVPLIDLRLSVPLEETAAAVCDNWQSKNQEIYRYLTEQLFHA
ncbi:MAG: DUF4364 family protein [Clostridium sp.]|nr:DUF4364 family protein [Clostridium sp.]